MNRRVLPAVILIIVGVAAIAAGVIYVTSTAHGLPSFFPGHSSNPKATGHRTKRGDAGLAFGVVVLVVGGVLLFMKPKRRHRR